jgi:DsbC/DsbD-like thiol-disulfide interchange protein
MLSRLMLRATAGAVATLLLVCARASAATPATPASHVRAELVSELESIQPGQPFWVGLHLAMDPGWHTSWQNPGDSGQPTRIEWTLPPGFEADPIEWPYPRPFARDTVVRFGYDQDVVLPVRITPPASLAPGRLVSLAARAEWQECREECLPGRADVAVTLPVSRDAPRPLSALAAIFALTRQRLPVTAAGWTFEATADGPAFQLRVRPPGSWGTIEHAYFFPQEAQVVDYTAAQTLAATADGYRLDLAAAPTATRPPARLRGVLLTGSAERGARAVRVEAPLTKKTGGR